MSQGNSELFGHMMQSCGLNFDATSVLLSTDVETIMVWFSGTRQPDETAIWKLAEFSRFQAEVADEILESWRASNRPAVIKYGVSVSDVAARALGWPSRESQIAAIAQAQIALAPIMIEILPMPIGERKGIDGTTPTMEQMSGADHAA